MEKKSFWSLGLRVLQHQRATWLLSIPGHKQAAAGTAAAGEEETSGGEAPPQSPGEQKQQQGHGQR